MIYETPLNTMERNGHEWKITRLHRAIPQMGRFIIYRDSQMWKAVDSYENGMKEIERCSKTTDEAQMQEADSIEPELEEEDLEL